MPIRIVRDWRKSDMRGSKRKNTPRENRLEELGRVDAEKAWTRGGKRNLKDEKKRIRKELATGSRPRWPKGYDPKKQMDPKNFPKRMLKPREEITDSKRKEGLIKKLQRPLPKPFPRKLTDQQKKILKKHFERKKDVLTKGPGPLRQRQKHKDGSRPRPQGPHTWVKKGKPKLAIKGWK